MVQEPFVLIGCGESSRGSCICRKDFTELETSPSHHINIVALPTYIEFGKEVVAVSPLPFANPLSLLLTFLRRFVVPRPQGEIVGIDSGGSDVCIVTQHNPASISLTASRYILRRAAVRALSQPSKSLSSFRPISTRVTTFQCAKPTLYRGFHQTWIWQADQQEKTPEERTNEQEKLDEIAPEELSDHEKQQILEGQEAQEAQDAALSQQSTLQEVVEPATNPPESADTAAYNETLPYEQPPPQEPLPATFAQSGSGGIPGARMPGPTADIKPSRILYVGNIFFEVTAAQLETEFSRFGEIANSRIVTDSRGLSKGFAYVEFASQDAADKAVRGLNQKVFQGRRMAVQYHIPRERQGFAPRRRQGGPAPPGQPSKVLFIGNMSYQMSDRDLNGTYRIYHTL